MKVAVASDDGKTISAHFGRTRGFVIYDVDNGEVKMHEFRPNTFTGHARGLEHAGHDIDRHGPVLAALADCAVVISHGMGRRLYNDLRTVGIESFITDEIDVQTAVEAYSRGELVDRPERGCQHRE